MKTDARIIAALDRAIDLGNECMMQQHHEYIGRYLPQVKYAKYAPFKASALTLSKSIERQSGQYQQVLEGIFQDRFVHKLQGALAVLKELRLAIESGYLVDYKNIVAAALFTDYLEMAEHILEEGYKDPAAVIIGSTLEEHIRQLCLTRGVDVVSNKEKPKKSELLNDELYLKEVYNLLDKKNVSAWLDLRNKAAHGQYDMYNRAQVVALLAAVREFIARVH